MGEEKRLDLLFYELASQSRLDILRTLREASLKMQDLARKLDLTATEATRQLQRLSQARLVVRQPDGAYAISEYGKLLLELSVSMEFIYKHDSYFLEHSVWCLPKPFVDRLGELSTTTLVADLNQDMSRWEALIQAADGHIHVMIPHASLRQVTAEKLAEGLKLRSIMNEDNREAKVSLPQGKNVERRLVQEVPFIIVISDKEASVSFPRLDGTVDFPAFFGNEPAFLKWANDLFAYYWEKAKPWRLT